MARRRVVVTRAAEQSGGLQERLVTAGYDVLEVPVIAIFDAADGGEALRGALAALASYDWVVVTSPNGAKRVADALAACDPAKRPRVAVVGPGTAEAIGAPVDLVASDAIGEGLVEVFPAGTGRVLVAQAEAARPIVGDGLRAKGWTVDVVVAYRTGIVPVAAELCERAGRADAIVFTSGSTVRGYLRSAGAAALPPVVVSIGPATTAVADELGVPVTVTAAVHTLDGVVAALIGVLEPDPG